MDCTPIESNRIESNTFHVCSPYSYHTYWTDLLLTSFPHPYAMVVYRYVQYHTSTDRHTGVAVLPCTE
jgi:hypothetical protein